MPQAMWLFCCLLAQTSAKPYVEVRRRLRHLPLIQQRHGLAELVQLARAASAGLEMLIYFGRDRVQAGGQFRHQFANFIAFHDNILHTNSFSCTRKVSYARNNSDLMADSLSFKTSAIWRYSIC